MQLVPASGQFNWTQWRKLNAYDTFIQKKYAYNLTHKIHNFIFINYSFACKSDLIVCLNVVKVYPINFRPFLQLYRLNTLRVVFYNHFSYARKNDPFIHQTFLFSKAYNLC